MSIGFVDSTVLPFFEELTHFLPKSHVLFEELTKNRCIWQALKSNHSGVFLSISDDNLSLPTHHMRTSSSFDLIEASSSLEDIISGSQDLFFGLRSRSSTIEKQEGLAEVANVSSPKVESSLIHEDLDTSNVDSSKLRRRWSIQPSHSENHLSCRRSSILSSSFLLPDDYLGK